MTVQIAYTSQGKLYLWSPDRPVREIESEFGREVQVRSQRMQAQKAWKTRSLMDMMMPPGMAAQLEAQTQEVLVNIAITSACPIGDGQVLYALESDAVSGVFRFDPEHNRENRLFHNADYKVSHLDVHGDRGEIACTKSYPNGTVNIATMPIAGSRPLDVTEGDSMDLAPRWRQGKHHVLVYQSAGLARDVEGYIRDRAPFTIAQLDFERQDVKTLAEDPKADLLGPQIDQQGWLYYIRRPYKEVRPKMTVWQTLKAIVMMPVRLIQAIYGFVDFFTRRYSGKPLMSAGEQKQDVPMQIMRAWGELVTPAMLRKGNKDLDETAESLVPDTWQLVRQAAQGEPEVLAKGVLNYDLAPDGTIVYTNGSAIFHIAPNGVSAKLCQGKLVESVVVI